MSCAQHIAVILLFTAVGAQTRAYADPPDGEKGARDVRPLLAKVRDKLKSAKSYHFERKTSIREAKAGGEPQPVVDLTFITIADFPQPPGDEQDALQSASTVPLPIPYSQGRFRFELKTPDGEFLQVGDGTNGWFYSSKHKMYRRGDTLRSLSESILGPVLANAHILPFFALAEGATKEARFVREEEIEVGKERRKCIVIQSRVPNADLAGMMKKAMAAGKEGKSADVNASDLENEMPQAMVAAGWNFTKLRNFGYLGDKMPAQYVTPAAKEKQFTDVTLWIDKERSLLVRAEIHEPVEKVADLVVLSLPAGKAELQVTEEFTVVDLDEKFQDELFTFVPPDGVKELGDGGGGPSWRHYAGGGVFSTAPPDLSKDGKQLVFSWSKTGHGDIYLYDLEKKQATRVTSTGAADLSPRFRPKHQEVLFERQEGPRTHIWIRDLNSGKEKPLTTGAGSDRITDVSPDGEYVAISKYDFQKPDSELQVLALKSGQVSVLPHCSQGLFRGSGETLICSKYGDKGYSVFEVDRQGKNSKTIAEGHYLETLDNKGAFALISSEHEALDQNNAELILLNLKTGERDSIGKGYCPCIFDNGKVFFVRDYKRTAWIWERGKGAHQIDSPDWLDPARRSVGNHVGLLPMFTGSTIISVWDMLWKKDKGRDHPYLFNADTEEFERIEWQVAEKDTDKPAK